jgi:transcriptional regulator with XRE-family HTH domain
MESKESLGSLLKARRKKLKLTTEELAIRAGIDRTYITKIEKDNKLPSPVIMEKVANVLSDEDLFKAYLRIKYPMVYQRVKARDLFLNVEIEGIMEQMAKKDMTLEEAKKLDWRIARFETLTKRAKIKLQKITKKLEEIENI